MFGNYWRSSRAALDWDVVEKVIVAALLGGLAARLIPAALRDGAYLSLMLLMSEACVVFFVLIRRRTNAISAKPSDWMIGFGGTLAALLAVPTSGPAIVPLEYCFLLMITGFAIQLYAKLTLRRSFGVIAANRGVKIGGPYRLVRHPMYAGYLLTHVSYLLSGPNLWNLVIYSLALALNVARLLAEERVLVLDDAYRAFQQRVRYRLMPLVF